MPRTPAVTVLMPVWKPHPLFFARALQSIITQTWQDFELLIVEDPSTCDVAEVLSRFDDPRIRHIRQPERTSLVDQLNRGIEEARGPLIARMDADDECEPERLQCQVEFMQAHTDIAICGTNVQVIDVNNRVLGYRSFPARHEAIMAAMPLRSQLAHPSVIMRTEVLKKVHGYQYRHYNASEDYELWCRLAAQGYRFANLDAPLLRYRLHSASVTSSHVHQTLRSILDVKHRFWPVPPTLQARLRARCERLMLCLPPRLILWIYQCFVISTTPPCADTSVPSPHPTH